MSEPGLARAPAAEPFATIEAMAEGLRRRTFSSVELTSLMLDRIATHDEELHAFSEVFADRALDQAKVADARLAAGQDGNPLLGVPLAVKDLFDLAGRPTRAGSLALDDRLPDTTATAVARLEAAGMVVVGRTQMVEFAYGGWGTNPVRGTPRNPWDRNVHRVPGGSSSGSAVAVASGLCGGALGTDTGGSIRTPAAWCGIVGLKTSLGLVSREGVVPLCPTHDTVGPMTRSLRDAAILFDALAGPDPRDDATELAPDIRSLDGVEGGVSGLRIGVLPERDLAAVDPAIRERYEAALVDYRALGVTFAEICLPLSIAEYLASGGDIMSVESYALVGAYSERDPCPVDPVIRDRILRGKAISGPDYYALLRTRRDAQAAFAETVRGFDAFVMPGSHILPIPLAEVDETKPPNHYGRLVNYLDLASLAIPIGLTPGGLPTGLQIVVRKFDDARALRIGRALERHRGGLFTPPPGY